VNHTAWLAQRALLAVALMIGFYVLALAIAVGLLWIPYAEWTYVGRLHIKIALACVASAAALVWAIIPRVDRFEAPGPTLEETSHRDLFKVIREVAVATRQEMPAEVYLVSDVNAWVTHRGGIMGVGSRRVMGLGLPLLQGLTVSELKAVLAHEFGHYAAGDVKLGPWIYKTRSAIGRTLEGLGEGVLSVVFTLYGGMFLRLTHAISREQEFLADALAARTVHPATMASALRRTEGLAPAFHSYWHSEVVPALNAGCLPPIAGGFKQYLGSEHVSSAVSRIVSSAAAHGESDPLDTHPPLRERLAALTKLPISKAPVTNDPPASTLLPDVESHARRLLEFVAGQDTCRKLKRVEWDHLAIEVYPKQWRASAAEFATFLKVFAADGIPAGRAAFIKAGAELVKPGQGDDDMRVARACQALSLGVAVALVDAGATPDTTPGSPVVFRTATATMEPFAAIEQLAEGTLAIDEWQAQCEAMGIAGRPLWAR
jgi:Zn-dependent protease with chaperone function